MNRDTIIAHTLANEVMDENYRGTHRINKHGLRFNSSQTMWKKMSTFSSKILQTYAHYYGIREQD